MADWRDGPEYAPTSHPYGFAAPRVAPLESPASSTTPDAETASSSVGTIAPPPEDYREPEAPALDHVTSAPEQTRDPSQPFDSGAGSFTGTTAWGAPGEPAWTPTNPITLSTPGTPGSADPSSPSQLPPPNAFPPPQGAPAVVAPGSYPPPGVQVVQGTNGAAPSSPSPYPPPQGADQPPYPPYSPTRNMAPNSTSTSRRVLVIAALLLGASLFHLICPLFLVAAVWVARVLPRDRHPTVLVVNVGTAIAFALGGIVWSTAYEGERWSRATAIMSGVAWVLLVIVGIMALLNERRTR